MLWPTQHELIKCRRGEDKVGVPATLIFRSDKSPSHPFSTFWSVQIPGRWDGAHHRAAVCFPSHRPRVAPLQGQGQTQAPHSLIGLIGPPASPLCPVSEPQTTQRPRSTPCWIWEGIRQRP